MDTRDTGLPACIIAAAACVLAIVLLSAFLATEPQESGPTYAIHLDCGNAALMHEHGLPTKADVMEWHVRGSWSYQLDGQVRTYWELPGRASAWDELYGIEDNPAFDK